MAKKKAKVVNTIRVEVRHFSQISTDDMLYYHPERDGDDGWWWRDLHNANNAGITHSAQFWVGPFETKEEAIASAEGYVSELGRPFFFE